MKSVATRSSGAAFTRKLSLGLAVLLIVAYALSMLFSLKTHPELFTSAGHGEEGGAPWPIGLALSTLAGVTVLVALVSDVFVESVQKAAEAFGMTPAFVGFIVVALVGGAAEMTSAFSGARKNRLDMSVGIALGSASQIALFVAPVLVLASYFIGPTPMDLQFWPGAVVMILIGALTAALVTSSGRSAWFVGALLLMVYLIFAMTLYLLPPRGGAAGPRRLPIAPAGRASPAGTAGPRPGGGAPPARRRPAGGPPLPAARRPPFRELRGESGMVDPDDGAPLESRPPLLEDLLTICRALNERGARYVVVGGMAVIHAGFVRATEDIDLLS